MSLCSLRLPALGSSSIFNRGRQHLLRVRTSVQKCATERPALHLVVLDRKGLHIPQSYRPSHQFPEQWRWGARVPPASPSAPGHALPAIGCFGVTPGRREGSPRGWVCIQHNRRSLPPPCPNQMPEVPPSVAGCRMQHRALPPRRRRAGDQPSIASSSSIIPAIMLSPLSQNFGSPASSPKGARSSLWCFDPPALSISKYFSSKPGRPSS